MTLDKRNMLECKLKKERGCFYYNETLGEHLECPDTDTCPESSK